MNISKAKLFSTLSAVIIALSIIITYSSALDGSFHLDDYDTIVNSRIAYSSPLEVIKQYPTRWIVFFTFKINTTLHAVDNFIGFHLVNIFIHILNAFLFFLLTRALCLHLKLKNSFSAIFLRANWTALLCALLFALHPLQSQSVIYITQRFMLLSSSFYLLSLYAVARSYLPGNSKKIGFSIAIISVLIGAFCKEIIVTAPLLALCMIGLFVGFPKLSSFSKKQKIGGVAIACMILILPILVFLQLSHWNPQRLSRTFDSVGGLITAHNDNLSQYTYLITQPSVLLNYVKLFIYPVGLNIDHDFPLCESWCSAQTVLPLFFAIALAYFAWKTRKISPFILFGLLTFVISLMPQSSIIPTPDLMFEHRAYLGVAGLCWMTAGLFSLIYLVFRSKKYSIAVVVLSITLILVCSVMTFQRGKIWQSEFSLWEDTYKKSPNKQRVTINYGNALLQVGENEMVIEMIEKVKLKHSHHLPALYSILGNAYAQSANLDKAIENYIISIKHERQNLDTRYNLASIYLAKGETAKSLHHLNMIEKYNPSYADAYLLEGQILADDPKRAAEAKLALLRYLELVPDSPNVDIINDLLTNLN